MTAPPPEPSFSDKHAGELLSGTGAILFLFWSMLPGFFICLALLVIFAFANFWTDRQQRRARDLHKKPSPAASAKESAVRTNGSREQHPVTSQYAAEVQRRAERNRTYLPPWRAIIFITILLVVVVAPFWGD